MAIVVVVVGSGTETAEGAIAVIVGCVCSTGVV